MARRMDIAAIKVGKRHRRDLGGIVGLADSIANNVGLLLQPIVVRRKGGDNGGWSRARGDWRLLGLLGHKTVPVVAHHDMDDGDSPAGRVRRERARGQRRNGRALEPSSVGSDKAHPGQSCRTSSEGARC